MASHEDGSRGLLVGVVSSAGRCPISHVGCTVAWRGKPRAWQREVAVSVSPSRKHSSLSAPHHVGSGFPSTACFRPT